MSVEQAQALLVGLLAALLAIVLGWVPEGEFSVLHSFLLSASSVLTAGIASFVLGIHSIRALLSLYVSILMSVLVLQDIVC